MAVLQVRMTDEELDVLKGVAAAAGFDSVSAYVRTRIDMRVPAVDPVERIVDDVNAAAGKPVVTKGAKPRAGGCARAAFHRPGTFCAYCKTTPSKKGE